MQLRHQRSSGFARAVVSDGKPGEQEPQRELCQVNKARPDSDRTCRVAKRDQYGLEASPLELVNGGIEHCHDSARDVVGRGNLRAGERVYENAG